jgi:hypothetical protein
MCNGDTGCEKQPLFLWLQNPIRGVEFPGAIFMRQPVTIVPMARSLGFVAEAQSSFATSDADQDPQASSSLGWQVPGVNDAHRGRRHVWLRWLLSGAGLRISNSEDRPVHDKRIGTGIRAFGEDSYCKNGIEQQHRRKVKTRLTVPKSRESRTGFHIPRADSCHPSARPGTV